MILTVHCWLRSLPDRHDRPDALARVHFNPVRLRADGFAPLRLVGTWKVDVADPRFGGVSALALDAGKLVALTDSGTVIRLPKPGAPGPAFVHDLGTGPGGAGFKRNRDSEALAHDADGRGWWVAFERWNQLWLYDAGFQTALARIDFGRRRWPHNQGIEAMLADQSGLTLFPEGGVEWLRIRGRTVVARPLDNRFGAIAEALRGGDGRALLVTRKVSLAGLAKRLVVVEEGAEGAAALRPLARLGLGALDNVEAAAAEPLAGGGTRLWLMTDNDFRARAPTWLVALDLP